MRSQSSKCSKNANTYSETEMGFRDMHMHINMTRHMHIAKERKKSLVWTVFFAVSAAGYGGIWRDTAGYGGIPGDTGRYREIPGDTRYGRRRADTGTDTGRYGEIRGDARRCKEIRGDTVRYCRDTSRYRKKTVRTRAKERKQTTQGRDGRTARRHHTGILRRGVWC